MEGEISQESDRQMNTIEVGQLWKTRGGWPARIIARIKSTRPLVVVHFPDHLSEECVESHDSDGSFFNNFADQTSWDLVSLLEEQ